MININDAGVGCLTAVHESEGVEHVYTHAHTYPRTPTHAHTHTHPRMHTHTPTHTHLPTHTDACTHPHPHTPTHAHPHTHTDTHTLTRSIYIFSAENTISCLSIYMPYCWFYFFFRKNCIFTPSTV